MQNLKIIAAGAGSGKTYRLTEEMVQLLSTGVRASGIIATTFTKKSAAELRERVRVKLLEKGLHEAANDLSNALIGTVHGVGVKLLKRFAFEAGVSPEVDIIADEDHQILFNKSLATVLTDAKIQSIEQIAERLGLTKKDTYDWRKELRFITEVARSNDFSLENLEESKVRSFSTFQQYLAKPNKLTLAQLHEGLLNELEETINALEQGSDTTKVTGDAKLVLILLRNELKLKGQLAWHQWVKITKLKIGAKSRDIIANLLEYAWQHEASPAFQKDIKDYIEIMFDIVIAAISEYERYKQQRGLIDYTDMEILVKRLLEDPSVQSVLRQEVDLLMVDEFQDTSPIQLDIFLKLSKLATHSIWVGDPKQSIYGFRGAEPRLMKAIIEQTGGIDSNNVLKDSWRSRKDIVHLTNAIFRKAFADTPEEQVVLQPRRLDEPTEANPALHHWHYRFDGEGKRLPGKPWFENCIATSISTLLERKWLIQPKGSSTWRALEPGDFGILCRSNPECSEMAKALHRTGLKAAIARTGLLASAEARLVLACLRYILNRHDSLSVAEILFLAARVPVEDIIEDRLAFIDNMDDSIREWHWALDNPLIARLQELRGQVAELSSTEILNLILDEMELRRIVAAWGKQDQRLDNIDMLRKYALRYEDNCNRLHTAASLGGFLLWLNQLESSKKDDQSAGEGADAVNVMTYHKSKGLEFPVVICHSLDNKLKGDVWGIQIISETETVDLDNVLGGRWLRYWVNPYSDQIGNTPIEERLASSEDKRIVTQQAIQEEARLLYVGITRARDYLILPSTTNATKWLNRVWHDGNEEHPVLDPDTDESIWDYNNEYLRIFPEVTYHAKDFGQRDSNIEAISFIEPRASKQSHSTYLIDPNENLNKEFNAQAQAAIAFYNIPDWTEATDVYQLGHAIRTYLMGTNGQSQATMASTILARYQVGEQPESAWLNDYGMAFYQYLQQHFQIKTMHRQYPIMLHRQGRSFMAMLDLVLETNQGIIVIQHNTNQSNKKWQQKAMEISAWCYLCRLALEAVFPNQPIQHLVNFVHGGCLVKVDIS